MYKKNDHQGFLRVDYVAALDSFLDYAYAKEGVVKKKPTRNRIVLHIRCPCRKCQNSCYRERDDVRLHLMKNGFMPDYTTWWGHGETYYYVPHEDVGQSSTPIVDHNEGYVEMVNDQMMHEGMTWEEETPNPSAQGFYAMLQAADEPLWDGCTTYTKLGAATRLLHWKAECNVPEATYDPNVTIIKEMLPEGNKLPANFYETKKCLKKLALLKVKIDACKNHCMLFYKLDSTLTHCLLQRLYMSKKTSKEMTWHKDHQTEPGVMVHPSDGAAWKHFDMVHPEFASESRNVRLGLCTDGFNPNNSNSNPYSLWPVFLTIYNLPPWMSLKDVYVKLALVIPEGALTYDAHRKNNFEMRAIVLWIVSNFPAYAMLSSWSTHGKLACPYCMGAVNSFQLRTGGKSCWFDCHRRWLPSAHPFRCDRKGFLDESKVKRSIFWELPYWKTLLIHHNLDVMHIEKNVFENLFNTIMDTTKTKDNIKARRDVEIYCNRPELHIATSGNKVVKPKASYTLSKQQVIKVCQWLKRLKFPDGDDTDSNMGCNNGVVHILSCNMLKGATLRRLDSIANKYCSNNLKLGSLKRTIRNKARVEGSIVEAYLVNELSTYCSLYFDPQIETRHNRESRNFAPDIPISSGIDDRLSIFKVPSRRLFEKGGKTVMLTQAEIHKIHTYVLLNCKEVMLRSDDFTDQLKSLARGPGEYAWSYKGYFVNGYKFHTIMHVAGRVTHNSGVCVRGSCYDDSETDYYGLLDDVLEVEYYSLNSLKDEIRQEKEARLKQEEEIRQEREERLALEAKVKTFEDFMKRFNDANPHPPPPPPPPQI
ncbi:hypothetical protein OSB04_007395 [Centaurea solstitialis]|uniref:Transposase-associated domain-containing protein n=1 Tax=Centaurea solstitialis TaxID=347529 RepID=A0AA38WQU8_9ASTR|nr:hypothetical protein OSB04_007395 [Centaurea solstitialis]